MVCTGQVILVRLHQIENLHQSSPSASNKNDLLSNSLKDLVGIAFNSNDNGSEDKMCWT